MNKALTIIVATSFLAGFAADASARKSDKRPYQSMTRDGMTTGQARAKSYTGGNSALKGNNGNSGQGSNSLGNIQGGNIGAGK